MGIPAIFKAITEVSKVEGIANGDVSSIASKGMGQKFDPDKRIDVKGQSSVKEKGNVYDPDKRIDFDKTEIIGKDVFNPDKRIDVNKNSDNKDISSFSSHEEMENLPKDVNSLQKECIKEVETNYTDLNELPSQAKGNYGEMKVDQDLVEKGYDIYGERVTDVSTPTGPGIDIVAYNKETNQYLIAEVKFNQSPLGMTADGKQMSTKWIQERLDSKVGVEVADNIRIEQAMNPDNVQSVLARVDLEGNITYFKLDGNAHVIGGIDI